VFRHPCIVDGGFGDVLCGFHAQSGQWCVRRSRRRVLRGSETSGDASGRAVVRSVAPGTCIRQGGCPLGRAWDMLKRDAPPPRSVGRGPLGGVARVPPALGVLGGGWGETIGGWWWEGEDG